MFDQCLRSPSPSPSPSPSLLASPLPNDAASELSGATLIDAVHDQSTGNAELCTVESRIPALEHPSEDHEAGHQEYINRLNRGPRIDCESIGLKSRSDLVKQLLARLGVSAPGLLLRLVRFLASGRRTIQPRTMSHLRAQSFEEI